MAISQAHPKRKASGGKYHYCKGKRRAQLGYAMLPITIGERKVKEIRCRSCNNKLRAMLLNEANVLDPKTGKHTKAKIVTVKANPANVHFVRSNTITKGAIIETSAGLARITSRPGQTGTLNAILVPASAIQKALTPKAEKAKAAAAAAVKTEQKA